jgi:hypothetical protein
MRQQRLTPARRLDEVIAKTIGRAMRRRGFAIADVLTRWPVVVGPAFATVLIPERIEFARGESANATLKVRVEPGFATEVQHLAPLIIERINGFYGYRAIARLKLIQSPLPKPKPKNVPEAQAPSETIEPDLARLLAGIEDRQLRAALESLGLAVRAGNPVHPRRSLSE